MEGKKYNGVVKSFRGSFGWVTCPEVAEQYKGRDVFLHKNSVNTEPIVGSKVAFRLTLDAKGNPKAEEAILEVPCSDDEEGEDVAPENPGEALGPPVIKRASLMLSRGEDILVLREDKEGKIQWSDLGGKVEKGESPLDCALRELSEEGAGFLAASSLTLLKTGTLALYGGTAQTASRSPEVVTLGGKGTRKQAVAVFQVDCAGIDLEVLTPDAPNAAGVHEMRWLSKTNPELRDRSQTRWPLYRTLCHFGRGTHDDGSQISKDRSRSPRRRDAQEQDA